MKFLAQTPPNPDDYQYRTNPLALARANFEWQNVLKGRLEQSQPLDNGVWVAAPQRGDIVYFGTSGWARLAAGTSTAQFLQSNGTNTDPKWGIPSTAPSGTAGGYLSGTYPNPNVAKVLGVGTSGDATAGDVGEYISSQVLSGAAIALSNGNGTNVTSIALTPGDWDVWGNVAFVAGAATTASAFQGAVGTSVAFPTSPGNGAFLSIGLSVSAGGLEPCLPVGMTRISTAGTSTAYLIASSNFAISTMGAYGFIGARRRR